MVDQEVQREARALGDPTRHRLFRYIAEAAGPVGVAELTEYVGLNHNAIRQHLAVLKDAGLVTERLEERSRPGRPRLLYRLSPETAGKWETPGAYAWLASLLTDALRRRADPREVGRQDGHRRASEITGAGTASGRTTGQTGAGVAESIDLLEAEIARRGFRPSRLERGRKVDFVLGRCPFAEVARSDPDTVCSLHLGLAEGLAEGLGGLEVQALVRKDPTRAGCRLSLRRQGTLAAVSR